ISTWSPGEPVWQGAIDGERIAAQVRLTLSGVLLSHAGAFAEARVYTDREARLARLMPAKVVADAGKHLICPMPGLIREILVSEGQAVKAGEALAVIEAMKMENVLRAERDATVKKIHASAGQSMAVDAVIMDLS
ncbi:MAG: biotin/lipoyl-containing protein, partial [Roseiarcus sp.]